MSCELTMNNQENSTLIWTREQLEQQRDEILSEFDFHEVREVMQHLNDRRKTAFCYDNISQYRNDAKSVIDDFINFYEKNNGYVSLESKHWCVSMSHEYDGVNPFLQLKYVYMISHEVEAYDFIKHFKL